MTDVFTYSHLLVANFEIDERVCVKFFFFNNDKTLVKIPEFSQQPFAKYARNRTIPF